MKKTILLLLIAAGTLASTFSRDLEHTIPASYKTNTHSHSVDIDIVIMKGKWNLGHVLKRFNKLRSVYDKCSVGVNISNIREVEWTYSGNGLYYDLNDPYTEERYEDGALQLLTDLGVTGKPTAIFFDSFDEYMPKLATSFPAVSLDGKSPALNTFWITDKVNEAEYLEREPDVYSVFAHELGHILLNDSHVFGEPNLMHTYLGKLNDKLTERQCERIRLGLLNN